LKALIIDDEIDICFLLSSILKNINLQPGYVNSITEAKRILEEDLPAVIFLDNHLPDGLGLDFLRHIKESYPSVKVIMITAHDNAADRKKANDVGADHFISKPFNREIIYKALEELA
jgi:DNA-binding response OmpR family regulator